MPSNSRPGFFWARLGFAAAACWLLTEPAPAQEARPPRIKPDYSGLVVPPNIAPLNFSVLEPGSAYRVGMRGASASLQVQSRNPAIQLPEKDWAKLLAASKGGQIVVDISVQGADGAWKAFAPLTNQIAREDIDPVLIYRKIHPVDNAWAGMGIYQRDLRSFKETPILENRRFDDDCCHCHILRNNDPATAMILIRSATYQNSFLIITNGQADGLKGSVGYAAFHPKTRLVVSAFTKPRLLLHTARANEMRDITELEGWLGSFVLGETAVKKLPFSDPSQLMEFPAWAPDGTELYYCSAPIPTASSRQKDEALYEKIKYSLMRVAYDPAADKWGTPETVVPAAAFGMSAAQPRVSPDGHWLYFCGTAYGCWPTYDPGSDLYGIDLQAARAAGKFQWARLDLNSDQAESILNWSSNSRWVVFSSKRGNPRLSRPWLAYVWPDGRTGKPFVTPQRDPTADDFNLLTYSNPTLATGPMTVPQKDLIRLIKDKTKPAFVMPEERAPNTRE